MNISSAEIKGFVFDDKEAYIAPCPFCEEGLGEPSIVSSKSGSYYTVMCHTCRAEGPKVDQEFYINNLHDNVGDESMDVEILASVCKHAALDMWNSRYKLH